MVPYATLSAYAGNLLLGRGLNLDLAGIQWKSLGLAAGDNDVGAEGGDLVRRAAADAAAAAGDDHGLAVEQSRLEDRAIRHVSSAV